jgi:hypothetical protein
MSVAPSTPSLFEAGDHFRVWRFVPDLVAIERVRDGARLLFDGARATHLRWDLLGQQEGYTAEAWCDHVCDRYAASMAGSG